ncbi:MAG: UDP-3-O-acyl-N-acetylglucosamine deacetylase, partial [Bacteroidales bacterium]|nr:UDP-3-O-acyl-N-acetylglucosamine deacetylase [Bacteroidales bacterium]
MSGRQKTIARQVSVSGKGLHTGVDVKLTFNPAPDNFGIQFQRVDIEDKPIIKADCSYVVDTNRGTTIGENGTSIYTIEHVMAAIKGMDIDNILVEIDNAETPIIDGSSRYFTEALSEVGVKEQETEREYFELDKVLSYTDP